jgi:hypothetical protein
MKKLIKRIKYPAYVFLGSCIISVLLFTGAPQWDVMSVLRWLLATVLCGIVVFSVIFLTHYGLKYYDSYMEKIK